MSINGLVHTLVRARMELAIFPLRKTWLAALGSGLLGTAGLAPAASVVAFRSTDQGTTDDAVLRYTVNGTVPLPAGDQTVTEQEVGAPRSYSAFLVEVGRMTLPPDDPRTAPAPAEPLDENVSQPVIEEEPLDEEKSPGSGANAGGGGLGTSGRSRFATPNGRAATPSGGGNTVSVVSLSAVGDPNLADAVPVPTDLLGIAPPINTNGTGKPDDTPFTSGDVKPDPTSPVVFPTVDPPGVGAPAPAGFALAALGGAALVGLRRKRKR